MENNKTKRLLLRTIAFMACCLLCALFLMNFTENEHWFRYIEWERASVIRDGAETQLEQIPESPEYDCTYLLESTLTNIPESGELYFVQNRDEITLYLDGSEFYSYTATGDDRIQTGATVYLPSDSEEKRLTVRFQSYSEDFLSFPVFSVKNYVLTAAENYSVANSSGIPGRIFALAFMAMTAMLLLNKCVDWRLLPLTLSFFLLTVIKLTGGQGNLFMSESFTRFVCMQPIQHLPILLMICHIILNRRRTDKRIFLRVTVASAVLIIIAYFISLAAGDVFHI